jgi:hypothetical protein
MQKSIIVDTFQYTDVNKVDVDLVAKRWNDNCFITKSRSEGWDKYTLVLMTKHDPPRRTHKIDIAHEQVDQIVALMKLKEVKSTVFRNASTFYPSNHIKKVILNVNQKIEEYERSLQIFRETLISLERARP